MKHLLMVRTLLLGLFLSLNISGVAFAETPAADPAESILAQFKSVQVFKGQFEQHKKLPILANPFISRGEFLSIRDKGLLWITQTPVPSTLIMVPGKVTQKMNGREQSFQATGTGYDGLAILLPALLDGDIKTLESYFTVGISGDIQQWSFALTPKSKELTSIVNSVSVQGEQSTIREVSLTGPEGDLTRIYFQSVTMSSEVPDAADLAHFN